MERRPVGVVVAAVAVGFVSLAMLGFAGMTAVSTAVMKNAPQPVATVPGAPAPSAAMMLGMVAFFAMVELVLAIWGGATTVGLLRLKSWARISVMILGGLLAAFSLLLAAGLALVPMVLKSTPMPAGTSPEQIHIVLGFMTAMCLGLAGLGVWWLAYFALKGTRAAFAPAAGTIVAHPVRVVAAPNPMTDFTFAQPLTPEERVEAERKDSDQT